MKYTYTYITLLAMGLVACEPEFDQPLEDTPVAIQSSGEADFSKYVAIGNSLTAGFADGTLYIDGQNSSFVNIIAEQMTTAGGGEFRTPLMSDNIGGFAEESLGQNPRLVFDPSIGERGAPVPISGTPTTSAFNILEGPFNNMGVPGARSFHLGLDGYGNASNLEVGLANPFFVRFASSPDTNILKDALTQLPTFVSLWIGGNDVLGYATTGGVGEVQPVPSPASPPTGVDITNPLFFNGVYNGIIDEITKNPTIKGILVNVPDVASLPFFTTVPNNALVLDEAQAAGLTGFFQIYKGILLQGAVQGAVQRAVESGVTDPAALMQVQQQTILQADPLLKQYEFTFNPGPNRFLIQTDISITNPRGIRQMTESELLLLTIDQNAIRTQGYGSVTISDEVSAILEKVQTQGPSAITPEDGLVILAAVNAIEDKDAIDSGEQELLTTATNAFNETIKAAADNTGFAFYDANARLKQLASTGIPINGSVLTNQFVTGGVFSLDGIHLSPKGNAVIANDMIQAINETYGSTLQTVNSGQRSTVTFK